MINLLNNNYTKKNNKSTKKNNKSTKKNNKSSKKQYSISFKNLNKKSFIKKMKHSVKIKEKKNKYKPPSVESYCKAFNKKDILGKVNKELYKSCKVYKYCRKTKCNKIDEKMIKEQTNMFGKKYNMFIQGYLRKYCPLTVTNKNRKLCEIKILKQLYKKYGIYELYNKMLECDKITCSKEKQIFYTNLFRIKQIKLNKKQKMILLNLEEKENPKPDMYLITS